MKESAEKELDKALKTARQQNQDILKWLTTDDFIDLDNERLTDEDIKNRAANATSFYKSYGEKHLKRTLAEQLIFISKYVETPLNIIWVRGIIEGINIQKRWFEEQERIHKAPGQDKEAPIEVMSD